MALKRSKIAMCVLMLALGGAYACGDDGNGGDEGNNNGGGNNGGDGDGDGEMVTLQIVDSVDTRQPQSGITVQFFNPETLELYPEKYTTDGSGKFTAPRPEGSGVFAQGNGDRADSWNHPPSSNHEKDIARSSSSGSASIVPAQAKYENDPEATPFAGSVYWHNDATDEDEPVGCAIIQKTEGVADIRYFTGPLPSSLEARGEDKGTHPNSVPAAAGKFFIANLAAGKRTITAMIGDKVIASREFNVNPRKDANVVNTTPPQNGNVHFGALFVDNKEFTTNPTPSDCK